jgi:hypothetical protein
LGAGAHNGRSRRKLIFCVEQLQAPRCDVKSGARRLRMPGEFQQTPVVDWATAERIVQAQVLCSRMTSVHQSKLVSEPLALLDQGLGQW